MTCSDVYFILFALTFLFTIIWALMKSSNKLKLLAIQLFDDFEILNQINLILNFNDLK